MFKKNLLNKIAVLFLFVAFVSCKDDDNTPVIVEPNNIAISGNNTHPEGIAINQSNGDIYVSGAGSGIIQKIVKNGANATVTDFYTGFSFPALGMTIDEVRNRLWVCHELTKVSVIDLSNGSLIKTFENTDMDGFRLFNDVILDNEGNAYISDSNLGNIWTVDVDLTDISMYVDVTALGDFVMGQFFNGISINPAGTHLITVKNLNQSGTAELYTVALADKSSQKVNLTGTLGSGGDGLVFTNATQLLVVNPNIGQEPLTKIDFTDTNLGTGTASIALSNQEARNLLNEPTTAKIHNNVLYMVNSQISIVISGTGSPVTPFTVTNLSLNFLDL